MDNRVLALVVIAGIMLPVAQADQYLVTNADHIKEKAVLTQQHTVYLEFVSQREAQRAPFFEEFGGVIGPIKICAVKRRMLDNAILWMNGQFLFGDKSRGEIPIEGPILGYDTENKTYRYIGCVVPDGFMIAVEVGRGERATPAWESAFAADVACGGCRFTYEESYYITDPNDFHWLVDRYRDARNDVVYIVHIQVDWADQEPIRDEAPWRWRDTGTIRQGTPRHERIDDDGRPVNQTHFCRVDLRCSLEYTFLFGLELRRSNGDITHSATTSSESKAGNSHPHNPTDGETHAGPCPADQWAQDNHPDFDHDCAQGTSPNSTDTPSHKHPRQPFDLFYARTAMNHTAATPYWDAYGAPPIPIDPVTCDGGNPFAHPAFAIRTFRICDMVADSGFHLHDGSQTIQH